MTTQLSGACVDRLEEFLKQAEDYHTNLITQEEAFELVTIHHKHYNDISRFINMLKDHNHKLEIIQDKINIKNYPDKTLIIRILNNIKYIMNNLNKSLTKQIKNYNSTDHRSSQVRQYLHFYYITLFNQLSKKTLTRYNRINEHMTISGYINNLVSKMLIPETSLGQFDIFTVEQKIERAHEMEHAVTCC